MKYILHVFLLTIIVHISYSDCCIAQEPSISESYYSQAIYHFSQEAKLFEDGPWEGMTPDEIDAAFTGNYHFGKLTIEESSNGLSREEYKEALEFLGRPLRVRRWKKEIKIQRNKGWKKVWKSLDSGVNIDPGFYDIEMKCINRGIPEIKAKKMRRRVAGLYSKLYPRWERWQKRVRFDIKANVNMSITDAIGSSSAPGAGGGFALDYRLSSNMSLLTETLFTLRQPDIDPTSLGFETSRSPYYEIMHLDIVPSLKYNLWTHFNQDFKVYALGGLETRYLLSAKIKFLHESEYSSNPEVPDISDSTDNMSFAFNMGIGMIRQTSSIYIIMELRRSMGATALIGGVEQKLDSTYLTFGIGF